jgi:tripartite-type tricarboxylate transporter receptor subunit TctC
MQVIPRTYCRFTTRRRWLAAGFALVSLLVAPAPVLAQATGGSPLTLIVPTIAGGAVDIIARTLGEDLSKLLGQGVIVQNRVGGSGNIAAASVARTAPNSNTLLIGAGSITIARQLSSSAQYDPDKDLTPIAPIGAAPALLVVSADSPVKTVQDLITLAKSKPGAVSLGHGGVGTVSEHLPAEMLRRRISADITIVGYNGGQAVMTDVVGGRVTGFFTNTVNAIPHVQSGRLRALAVMSDTRLRALPDVPTAAEAGLKDLNVAVWWAVFGPAGMDPGQVETLNKAVRQAVQTGAIRARLEAMSAEPVSLSHAEFKAFYAAEAKRWRAVVQQAGLKPE